MINDIWQWIGQNTSWFVPIVYLAIQVVCSIILYWRTTSIILATATQIVFSLLFIFAIYIPFHTNLRLEAGTLIGFITVIIVMLASHLFYIHDIHIDRRDKRIE